MQSPPRWLIALLAATAMSAAPAQQPTEPQTRSEDPAVDTSTLEPAVDTSATPSDDAADGGRSAPQGSSGTSPESLEPAVDTSATPAPSAATAPNAAPAPAAPGAAGTATRARGTGRGSDRLELDTTQITGNRELPKVLYIVPWKRADLGDLTGRPVNSLLDEVLTPVDRDVFRRENRYYRSLQGATEAGGASGASAGAGPEK
jgi:hypothetical protein